MAHGAGGAGKAGTDAIYGGHSHVGTMIYLGDNWPDEFRGHLFTHNLGGHQINHMINKPLGSGFETVDEGHDMAFCSDPKYVAVDLHTALASVTEVTGATSDDAILDSVFAQFCIGK
jgi:hypothetical protein